MICILVEYPWILFYAGEKEGRTWSRAGMRREGLYRPDLPWNLNVDALNIISPRGTLIFFISFGFSNEYLVHHTCYIDLYWIAQKCRLIHSLPRDGQGTPEFRAATVPFEPFKGEARNGIPDKQSRLFPFSKGCIKPCPLPRSRVYLTTTTTANTAPSTWIRSTERVFFFFFLLFGI